MSDQVVTILCPLDSGWQRDGMDDLVCIHEAWQSILKVSRAQQVEEDNGSLR